MATVGEILVLRGQIQAARDVLAEMPRFALWDDPVDELVNEAAPASRRALDASSDH